MASRKSAYREEGNRLYKRAHAEGNSPYIRKVLLTKGQFRFSAPSVSGFTKVGEQLVDNIRSTGKEALTALMPLD